MLSCPCSAVLYKRISLNYCVLKRMSLRDLARERSIPVSNFNLNHQITWYLTTYILR
jgi:hypothetical protein